MKVLVTGANGFVGKNLLFRLKEENISADTFARHNTREELEQKLRSADFVVHLAGVNRPKEADEYKQGNAELTKFLCDSLQAQKNSAPVIYSSSIQVNKDNLYGDSKKLAEAHLNTLTENQGNATYIYRLPNIFGKWCKPNYNSVVATFCNGVVNDLPIKIHDPEAIVNLVYIDDVVNEFIRVIKKHINKQAVNTFDVNPVYKVTVGELEKQLREFKDSNKTLTVGSVGNGFTRALYATYISYYKPSQFSYSLAKHEDDRGVFVEMLKTESSGQFSFFTAHPGVTRGGHYHHTKNEKFLVLQGKARFGFRNLVTDEYYELETRGEEPQVVETIPGWSHDITNTGDTELFVMLWANEIFDREAPDTFNHKVK